MHASLSSLFCCSQDKLSEATRRVVGDNEDRPSGRRDGPEHESSIATRVGKATRYAKAGHKSGLDKRVLKAQYVATALVEKGTLVSALSHAVASSTQHQLRNKEEHSSSHQTFKT